MKLDSTVAAVVTGGASGLGEATARALAAKGVKVAIFDLQADKGEALAAEIGGVFCNVNVTSDESVDAGFAKARAAHGQERILVNCAGTGNAVKTASRSKDDGSIKQFPLDAFEASVHETKRLLYDVKGLSPSEVFAVLPSGLLGTRLAAVSASLAVRLKSFTWVLLGGSSCGV
jgi:NAD(P)-dependent dehydrogenase (short-subunit alcohol dehydrogenase family)